MALFSKKNPEGDTEMSFLDHLEALRWHIVRSVVMILVFFIIALFAKKWIFDVFIFGPTHDDFITYRALCKLSTYLGLGDLICMKGIRIDFINTELAGQFMMHIKISFLTGFICAFPFLIWEVWRFVKPGLYETESRYTEGIVFFTSFLFLVGVAFSYFVLVPFSVNFFATYTISESVTNMFTITDYISFLTIFLLSCGLIFELPMIVYFLSKIGILTPAFMREYRRHAIVVLMITAAVITPTADVGTMMLVFVPLYFLYEISIFISAAVERNREKEMLT
jgi:sec-independent protein translocase protein TatC